MGLVHHYPPLNRPAAPVCSVCIANYNGINLLTDCLESVLAQQGEFSVEIIVHDDASTDDSVALLREKYPQVELLASTQNVGFCVSNNRMVARARGEYILLLNNDAALAPDALQTLLHQAMQQHPQGILTLPQYDWETGSLVDRGCLLDPFYNPVPNTDLKRQDVAMVIGACLWMPRKLWKELGGFPEWFESVAEDLYLCCRARLAGYPVQVTPASHYRHRQGLSFGGNRAGKSGLATTYRRRRLSERNKTSVMLVCTPTAAVWPLLALHMVLLAIEGLLVALAKHDLRPWREIYGSAIRSTFAAMKKLRSLRRIAQLQRHVTLCGYLRGFLLLPQKLRLLKRYGFPKVS
jgi:GT2 family glycosyltransferase